MCIYLIFNDVDKYHNNSFDSGVIVFSEFEQFEKGQQFQFLDLLSPNAWVNITYYITTKILLILRFIQLLLIM